jgi:hypothetical protein
MRTNLGICVSAAISLGVCRAGDFSGLVRQEDLLVQRDHIYVWSWRKILK